MQVRVVSGKSFNSDQFLGSGPVERHSPGLPGSQLTSETWNGTPISPISPEPV